MTLVTLTDDILQQVADMQAQIRRLQNSIVPDIRARVRRTTDQTIGTSSTSAIQFDSTEDFDTASMHDSVTNNTRVYAPVTGCYLTGGGAEWESNSSGNARNLLIIINGTTTIDNDLRSPVSGNVTRQTVASTPFEMQAGDYVELYAFQNSGGDVKIKAVAYYSPVLWLRLLSV